MITELATAVAIAKGLEFASTGDTQDGAIAAVAAIVASNLAQKQVVVVQEPAPVQPAPEPVETVEERLARYVQAEDESLVKRKLTGKMTLGRI